MSATRTRTTSTTSTRTAAVTVALAGATAGLTALGTSPAAAAGNPAAFVGDRGLVVAGDRHITVREPGEGRTVVQRNGARVAYAAGQRVVWETDDGRVLTRDLESTFRLEPGRGVDNQKLLGLGQVGRSTIAVLEEERVPTDRGDAGAYRSDLVTYDVNTDERTVLRRGLSSFEGGYTNAHVFDDGSVVASSFQSVAIVLERYAADGAELWTKRVGSDEVAELAVIRDRVTVIRTRSRGGDTFLRIVRLDAATGERRNARGVRVPDAAAVPFCQDWRTTQRLLCQSAAGPVVIDTIGSDAGDVVNRVRAPRGAFASVIGGR
ncbi:hypothetical protein KLP28_02350 [Nocardioidaceae bacterium]|nr:hypothetical protein KLP28_02350 [Nocardioidaceae bacterium]